jgi:hypothetical protein
MTVVQQHDDLFAQRRNHSAWKLLAADNPPLVIGFLDRVFLTPHVRQLPGAELAEVLEDHLYALHAAGATAYRKTAEAYLTGWVDAKNGWLRRSSARSRLAPVAPVSSPASVPGQV